MAGFIPIPPDMDLVVMLQHEVLVRNINAAAGALWTYDILLNLDLEFTLIWASLDPQRRPFRLKTALFDLLYLAQRYLPLLDRVILDQYFLLGAQGARACSITYSLSAWSSILGVVLAEFMLALRIWVVWARNPSIGIIIVVLGLACAIPAVIFFARYVGGIHFPELEIPGPTDLKRCFHLLENRDIYICWIILLVCDIASFVLMAIPGYSAYRSGGKSNLITVVYRDGVVYYALISLVSLVNVIIILVLPYDLLPIITAFERVLHSVLASHAILHIRKYASENVIEDHTLSTRRRGGPDSEYSEMLFAVDTVQSRHVWEQETRNEDGTANGFSSR